MRSQPANVHRQDRESTAHTHPVIVLSLLLLLLRTMHDSPYHTTIGWHFNHRLNAAGVAILGMAAVVPGTTRDAS